MSNVKISDLTEVGVLSGTASLEISQGGASYRTTAADIAGTRVITIADISDMSPYGQQVAASASLSALLDAGIGTASDAALAMDSAQAAAGEWAATPPRQPR